MAKQPNILLFVIHDLGTRLGCYEVPSVKTPHLDRLAREGVLFENHFTPSPYCSPSRGSLISGQYPHVNGLMGLVNLGWDWKSGNRTIAQHLGEAGYETYLFGLQHEAQDVKRLGFDHVSDQTLSRRCKKVAPLVADFLKQQSTSAEKPFYARVGFSEAHRDYASYEKQDPATVTLPPFLKDTPGAREDMAMCDGSIMEMDESIGLILEALQASGQADNTLVIFTVDHGLAFPGAKGTLYDAGLRVALLARWPGGIQAGQRVTHLTSHVDLLPTLAEIAGAPPPEGIQGRSFAPLFAGASMSHREFIFAEKNTTYGDVKRCLRTRSYKYIINYDEGPSLHLASDIEMSLTRRDLGDAHLKPRAKTELYDLKTDPLERNNLSGQAQYQDTEANMANRLAQYQQQTNDPILHGPLQRPAEEAPLMKKVRDRVSRVRAERGW